MLSSGNDLSLITTTGLDFSVFEELKGRCEAMYSKYSLVPVRGRYVKLKATSGRRLINGEDCLGLVLVWSNFHGSLIFYDGPLVCEKHLYKCEERVWSTFGKRKIRQHILSEGMVPPY